MADVNTYALSIQLNFESNAQPVLDDVTVRLERINDQITQIAQTYNTALGGAAQGLSETTDSIASSFSEINDSLDQSWPIVQDMADVNDKQQDNLEEQLDTHQQIHDVLVDDTDELNGHLDLNNQILDVLEDAGDGVARVGDGLRRAAGGTDKVARGFFDMFLGIEAIKAAFADFLDLEEDFITANYRLYGAQEQIVRQVNDISDEYDLLRGIAHDAMKSLAISLRVPREELGKYVAQVSMFQRATGASIENTSEWTRSMVAAGFSSRDTERSLARMVLMMRQAGFTTEQINRQLNQEQQLSAALTNTLGKEGVQAYEEMAMANMVLVKSMHGDADAMQRVNEALVSNISLRNWVMGLGLQRLTAEDIAGMNEAQIQMRALEEGMYPLTDIMQRIVDQAGGDTSVAIQQLGNVFANFGIQGADAHAVLLAYRNALDEGVDSGRAARVAFADLYKQMQDDAALAKEFADSMNTVKAQWEKALRPLFNAWINLMIALKPVMLFIIDLVGILADVLAFLINTIAAIINPIDTLGRQLDGAADSGEKATGFFKRLGEGLLNFGKALPGIIIGLAAMAGLYYGLRLVSHLFINWVNAMNPANLRALALAFVSLGAAMLMVSVSMTIIASLGWKAAGALVVLAVAMAGMVATLAFLASVAETTAVPLTQLAGIMLAFGAAALMIAGSLWVVAQAMKTMAELGWMLVASLAAVAAVVGLFAAVLIGFGAAATPVAPGILAIGAAFLMMGAAVWLVAEAFETVVDSFAKLGKSAQEIVNNAGALFTAVGIISVALLALSVVAAVTAIPLLALGLALMAVGAAARMITGAFEAAVEVIKTFSDIDKVKEAVVGLDLAIASMLFTLAAVAVIVAPVLPAMFLAAAALLAVGAAAWLTAKAVQVMVESFKEFGDMNMIVEALAGISMIMVTLAAVAMAISPALPALILFGVAMVAVGAGAWMMAQGMSAAVETLQEFADLDTAKMVQAGWDLAALGIALTVAATTIAVGSSLMIPAAALFGVAMGLLSAALWLVPLGRIQEIGESLDQFGVAFERVASLPYAELDSSRVALYRFAVSTASSAALLSTGAALMLPASFALSIALAGLSMALLAAPIARLVMFGVAMRGAGEGTNVFAESLSSLEGASGSVASTLASINSGTEALQGVVARIDDVALRGAASIDSSADALQSAVAKIDAIAVRGDNFAMLASTLDSAFTLLEDQAARADNIASSLSQLNDALNSVMSGPPKPVYGSVAAALSDNLDAIDEQIARAEGIYAPLEDMSAQAEMGAALSGEPAPSGYAETVNAGLGPETAEDYMALSNYINLKKQTELLERLLEEQTEGVVDKAKGFMKDLADTIKDALPGGGGNGGGNAQPAGAAGGGE